MKNQIEQHLFFSRNDVEITETELGLQIKLRSCKSLNKPGMPDFPGKIIRVALPEKTEAIAVHEEVQRTSKITQEFQVMSSVQEKHFVYLDENNEPVTSDNKYNIPDRESYIEFLENEQPVVELVSTEWIDEVPMAVLRVVPVRYVKNGTMDLIEIVKVNIEVKAVKHPNPVPLKIRKKRFQNFNKVHRMIANPDKIEGAKVEYVAGDFPEVELKSGAISVPDDVDYLIVTDNKKWNENITPGAATGDMVAEFQRVATWKQQRGLRTHIALIQDIVDGKYGNFSGGARDLQEVIRNFLKSFCAAKGVEWLLIGGDVGVVPVRIACGSAHGRIYKGKAEDTESGSTDDGVLSGDNTIAWKGSFLGMRVKLDDGGVPVYGRNGHILTNFETGLKIPFDSTGASSSGSLGWYFTTDDSFATHTATKTQWIRVNGPNSQINNTMVWYTPDNMIPTDLYYSSLYSSHYVSGKKDWDHLNNGLYAQHSYDKPNMDGTDFVADIGLGRAPVQTQDEARIFVDKVIEYEQWDLQPDVNSIDRFKKMLYVSANWGKYTRIKPNAANANPPANYEYYSNPAGGYSLLNVVKTPPDVGSKLICHYNDSSRIVLSLSIDADASHPGWYYAKSDTDLSPSFTQILWIKIPVPTTWIVVYGANNAQLTPMYYALDKAGQDSSMTEQETLRKWMESHFYRIDQIQRLYTDETDLTPADYVAASIRHLTSENLETALNMGPHFVSLSGHGNRDWVAYLNTALINSTTNGNKTSIMIADSCLTNKYDYEDSVGENALKHENGGAVAYIGNSRYSWVGLGDEFRLEFFKTMQMSRHLADLNDSRCNFANHNDIYKLWVILAQNMNGDPEMPVFRDYADAIPRYVGNTRTLELHRKTCQWVEKMAYSNMVYFDSVENGLSAGHEGCYYCLREHHIR
ncbi:C25 family cysteine peptidase [Maribellus mangrovi]|uniref:C25 family cysteine peptidase n=1 Tax=Maribellus mangrovi TaxID=3133146 RepID=UPI0030EFA2A0